MGKLLIIFFTMFFIFGCSAVTKNQPNSKNFSDIKNVKNLTELNQLLPITLDDDTVLVSVINKKRNNRDILVYNYRLTKYEKGFINIEQTQMKTYITHCVEEIKKNDGAVVTFSYSDKNSVYIGEFNFSKQICLAIYYEYKNNPEMFRKYLYSLSDIDFMHMALKEKNFKGEFKKIIGDRLLDTDLDVE